MVYRSSKLTRVRELSTLAAACTLLVVRGQPAYGMDAGTGAAHTTKDVSPDAGVVVLAEQRAISDNATSPLVSAQDAQPQPDNSPMSYSCRTTGPFPPIPKPSQQLKGISRAYIFQLAKVCLLDPQTCNPEYVARAGRELHATGVQLEIDAWDLGRKIAAASSAGRRDEEEQLREKQRRYRPAIEKLFRTAVDYYEKALKLPQTVQIDDLLMNLGAAYAFLKQDKLAIEYYQRLIHEVPTSKHVPFAHLAIGNIRFASGDWQGADGCYAMVLSLPPSPAVICALYKQAWTDFRRGFPALARKSFEACQRLQPGPVGGKGVVEFISRTCAAEAKRLGLVRD
jgi:hypothetical protein